MSERQKCKCEYEQIYNIYIYILKIGNLSIIGNIENLMVLHTHKNIVM